LPNTNIASLNFSNQIPPTQNLLWNRTNPTIYSGTSLFSDRLLNNVQDPTDRLSSSFENTFRKDPTTNRSDSNLIPPFQHPFHQNVNAAPLSVQEILRQSIQTTSTYDDTEINRLLDVTTPNFARELRPTPRSGLNNIAINPSSYIATTMVPDRIYPRQYNEVSNLLQFSRRLSLEPFYRSGNASRERKEESSPKTNHSDSTSTTR
jgi:hypothetical protein